MRVVHVVSTPSGLGGAERVIVDLVEGAPDVEQLVLNPFAIDPEAAHLRRALGGDRYEGRRATSLAHVPGLLQWLRARISHHRPDVVHAHLFHAEVLTSFLPRRLAAAWTVTHHHGDLLVASGRRFDVALDRAAGHRADRIVAVSEAGRRFLRDRYGYDESRIEVILNGWSGVPQPQNPPSRPRVVCVARLRAEKSHDVLLDAWALLADRFPDAELLLVGDGPRRSDLERRAGEMGGRVIFAGHVDDVWGCLATSTLFVLPSSVELLGISVLEAMAAGVPVVATAVGGVPEIVEHECTGLLVPPGDPAALAAAIERLLGDPSLRATLAAAGLVRAADLRAEKATARYVQLWSSLVRHPLR